MRERDRAIVLVSGGMDSLVTLAIAAQTDQPALLHVTYGQRTADRERRAFRAIADHFGIARRLEADVAYLAAIGGSSLTDARRAVRETGIVPGEPIPDSYVPFRNTHLIAIGVSWA